MCTAPDSLLHPPAPDSPSGQCTRLCPEQAAVRMTVTASHDSVTDLMQVAFRHKSVRLVQVQILVANLDVSRIDAMLRLFAWIKGKSQAGHLRESTFQLGPLRHAVLQSLPHLLSRRSQDDHGVHHGPVWELDQSWSGSERRTDNVHDGDEVSQLEVSLGMDAITAQGTRVEDGTVRVSGGQHDVTHEVSKIRFLRSNRRESPCLRGHGQQRVWLVVHRSAKSKSQVSPSKSQENCPRTRSIFESMT